MLKKCPNLKLNPTMKQLAEAMNERNNTEVRKLVKALMEAAEYIAAGRLHYKCAMALLFDPDQKVSTSAVQFETSTSKLLYQGIVEAVIELKMSIRVVTKKKLNNSNIDELSTTLNNSMSIEYLDEDKMCELANEFRA